MNKTLSDAEQERLIKLAEECGEVIQIIAKVLVYGYDEVYPKQEFSNKERLEQELGDIRFWMLMMCMKKDINFGNILFHAESPSKYKKAMQYTKYQDESVWSDEKSNNNS